jgi:hypothetical protein
MAAPTELTVLDEPIKPWPSGKSVSRKSLSIPCDPTDPRQLAFEFSLHPDQEDDR